VPSHLWSSDAMAPRVWAACTSGAASRHMQPIHGAAGASTHAYAEGGMGGLSCMGVGVDVGGGGGGRDDLFGGILIPGLPHSVPRCASPWQVETKCSNCVQLLAACKQLQWASRRCGVLCLVNSAPKWHAGKVVCWAHRPPAREYYGTHSRTAAREWTPFHKFATPAFLQAGWSGWHALSGGRCGPIVVSSDCV
jgi:hypothetical protein